MSCSQAIRGKGVRRLMVLAISFAGGYPVTVTDAYQAIVYRSKSSGLAKMSMHEASPTADGNIWPWKGIYLLCWMAPSI